MSHSTEQTLSYIYELISEGIWDWNLLTGKVDRSESFLKLLGYAKNDLKEHFDDWKSHIHQDDQLMVTSTLEKYSSGEIAQYQIRYRCKKADGVYIWIEDSGKFVEYTNEGSPSRMIGVYTEIDDPCNLEKIIAQKTKELREQNSTLEKKLRQVEHSASLDVVTGIYNRRTFEQKFNIEISRATRYDYALSIILLDIDNFKHFNDTYGHKVGDIMLKQLAHVLGENIRNFDLLARWGGEEFAIILPNTQKPQAAIKAEHLRKIIENNLSYEEHILTCSIGVAALEKNDNSNSIFVRVDKALYLAKNNNRNNVKVI